MKKKTILKVESVYTANSFVSGGRRLVAAGSETTGEVFLYDMESDTTERVDGCPGGVMSFVGVPGQAGLFYSIMGLFPGFNGKDAGVFMHRRTSGGWKTEKVFALPFAHRCDVLHRAGENYLFAVSVSQFKDEPSDWSRAGEIYVMKLDPDTGAPGTPELVDKGIFRNHGMLKTETDGHEHLMVSGAEGIFSLELGEDGKWRKEQLFDREVSEFAFVDLDGDGCEELVTIEPFHGENLRIYSGASGAWTCRHEGTLAFGHGLSAGLFGGKPLVVVGNRRGLFELQRIAPVAGGGWNFCTDVLEGDAGPTQTQIFRFGGQDYILSANQRKNEVDLYYE